MTRVDNIWRKIMKWDSDLWRVYLNIMDLKNLKVTYIFLELWPLSWDMGEGINSNFFLRKGLYPYITSSQIVFLENLNTKIKTHFSKSDLNHYNDHLKEWQFNLDFYKIINVGEVKLEYYADAECSDMPRMPCERYQLLQTCILFAGGVCMSECTASAQGPNFTSPSIFHFI